MILRCIQCQSSDVRQEWSALIDPNDKDNIKDFDPTSLDFQGFEYCCSCQDETTTYESQVISDTKRDLLIDSIIDVELKKMDTDSLHSFYESVRRDSLEQCGDGELKSTLKEIQE